MPAIFYRYTWDGEKILKTPVERQRALINDFHYYYFTYMNPDGSRGREVKRFYNIVFGVYDVTKRAVFLKEDNAEQKAAEVFAEHYCSRYQRAVKEADEMYKIFTTLTAISSGCTIVKEG